MNTQNNLNKIEKIIQKNIESEIDKTILIDPLNFLKTRKEKLNALAVEDTAYQINHYISKQENIKTI